MTEQLSEMMNSTNIGLVLGVAGILFAVWTYLKTREVRQALYRIKSENIIGGPNPEFESRIEIRCDSVVIPRVTKTTVWFWNGGNRTIRRDDISKSDPIRIKLPDGAQVIEAKISGMTTPANSAGLEAISSNRIIPSFEFLDGRQGFACEILHTALPTDVSMAGTLIGAGEPRLWNRKTLSSALMNLGTLLPINLAVFALFLSVAVNYGSAIAGDNILSKMGAFFIGLSAAVLVTESIQKKVFRYFDKREQPENLSLK